MKNENLISAFAPLDPVEVRQYVFQCAARTAFTKGLKNSEWYFYSEIHDYLKNNHPATFEIFDKFVAAFNNWATAASVAARNDKLDPMTEKEIQELSKKRDEARKELLDHLGLNK